MIVLLLVSAHGMSTPTTNGHRCSFSVPGTKLFVYAETLCGNERAASDVTANQLWPASRAAASYLATHARQRSVCELGCGLGAPSLAAAHAGCRVVATDVDEEALARVSRAASEQGLELETTTFDLCDSSQHLPRADLYVFADVVGTSRLAQAVHARIEEAVRLGSRSLVSLETSRPQRDGLLLFLSQAGIPYSHQREEEDALVILMTVDEDDPSLYK